MVLTSAATMTWKKVYLNSMPSTFFFRKVGLDGLQIDALGDVGFVVGAVGVDDAHDKVQGVGLAQEHRVSAVAPASLRSLAHGVSSFLSDFLCPVRVETLEDRLRALALGGLQVSS